MSVNLQAGQDSCNPDIWNQVLALVASAFSLGALTPGSDRSCLPAATQARANRPEKNLPVLVPS